MEDAPIIVTLLLDDVSKNYFTQLRNQYFPSHINYLQAHVSLFHHLPPNETLVQQVLQAQAKHPIFDIAVTGVKNIGNGTAFTIHSNELQTMHKSMQQCFEAFLTPQDKQKIWPHITIQNKVSALEAKQTTDVLRKNFKPFTASAIGLTEWFYLKGPWKKKMDYFFDKKRINNPRYIFS